MKILPLLLGSLVASITFGGAFAQMYGPQGGYNSPPAYGTSINPPLPGKQPVLIIPGDCYPALHLGR